MKEDEKVYTFRKKKKLKIWSIFSGSVPLSKIKPSEGSCGKSIHTSQWIPKTSSSLRNVLKLLRKTRLSYEKGQMGSPACTSVYI